MWNGRHTPVFRCRADDASTSTPIDGVSQPSISGLPVTGSEQEPGDVSRQIRLKRPIRRGTRNVAVGHTRGTSVVFAFPRSIDS